MTYLVRLVVTGARLVVVVGMELFLEGVLFVLVVLFISGLRESTEGMYVGR